MNKKVFLVAAWIEEDYESYGEQRKETHYMEFKSIKELRGYVDE